MKFGLWLVAALLLGGFAAHFLLEDKGYVLINFRGYAVEMSVPVLLVVLLVLYLLARVLARLWRAPRRLGEAAGRYRSHRAGRQFTRGMIEYAEGNWSKGEKILTRGVRQSDAPLINYLVAARAAQLQGADDRRDTWLRMAYDQTPGAGTAVLLTQAELQIAHGQHEEALATLRKLDETSPRHVLGMRLLGRLYRELEDWDNLLELLPRLRKRAAGHSDEIDELSIAAFTAKLQAKTGDEALEPEQINAIWRQIPRRLRGGAQAGARPLPGGGRRGRPGRTGDSRRAQGGVGPGVSGAVRRARGL